MPSQKQSVTGSSVSFARDIAPLFRKVDIQHMQRMGVLLDDYTYMSNPTGDPTYPDHANANYVYGYLTGALSPRMPMGGPYWTVAQLQIFNNWMTVAPTYQP